MLATAGTVAFAAAQLISAGFFLGTGLWVSKKFTNKIEEVLLKYDKRELERIHQETQQEIYG